ncbi:hypothetical protein BGZ76_011685, partial [Entomortierella beljakovae]
MKDLIETFSTYGEITVLGIYYHHETNIFEGEGMMIIDTEHFGTPSNIWSKFPNGVGSWSTSTGKELQPTVSNAEQKVTLPAT